MKGNDSSSPWRRRACRGGIGLRGFASANFGLRAVAQSMARELAPKNIHVAHLSSTGAFDTAFVGERIQGAGRPDALDGSNPISCESQSIANAYWQLHVQTRAVDVRTRSGLYREPWLMGHCGISSSISSPNAYPRALRVSGD